MVAAHPQIEAKVEGTNTGQIAVGSQILQIGNISGGIVYIATASGQFLPEPRNRPVLLRPSAFPAMLDREGETETIRAALAEPAPVSVYGSGGVGKTSLLKRTAHLPETESFRDGVIYLKVKGMGLEDILQLIFDNFYSSLPGTKQNGGEIRHGLNGIHALILLDDLTLSREDVDSLLNVTPNSVFIFASLNRNLWGNGRVVPLRGLPAQQAVQLFERELGRTLTEPESVIIRDVVSRLEDHPQRILHLAGILQDTVGMIPRLHKLLKEDDPDLSSAQISLKALEEPLKKILAVLAAARGGVMPLEHLAALAQIDRLPEALDTLLALELIEAHSPRYSLSAVMSAALPRIWNLDGVEDRLIQYFTGWLEKNPGPEQVEESHGLLWQLTQMSAGKERWQDVIRLGRALEPVFIMSKRWQAWEDLLRLILNAARMLKDRYQEAWALHQLGTRSLCLGATDQARSLLSEAFHIRKDIGDEPGLSVTRHNLEILRKAVTIKVKKPKGPGPRFGPFSLSILFLAMIGAGGLFTVSNLWDRLSTAPPVAAITLPANTFTFEPDPTIVIASPTSVVIPASQTPTSTTTNTPTSTPSATPTSTSTGTSSPTPTATVTPLPCNLARFGGDVTIPDGTIIQPGTAFTKTWRLKNEGSCSWNQSYQIIFVSGDSLSNSKIFPWSAGVVNTGGTADVSVHLIAPAQPGSYQAYFMLLAPNGTTVGLGAENKPFWVKITVPSPPITDAPLEQDDTPPPPPENLYPADGMQVDCSKQVVFLEWDKVFDESGILEYQVVINFSPHQEYSEQGTGKWVESTREPRLEIPISCGYSYQWYVRAIDNAGNEGEYSKPAYFEAPAFQESPG